MFPPTPYVWISLSVEIPTKILARLRLHKCLCNRLRACQALVRARVRSNPRRYLWAKLPRHMMAQICKQACDNLPVNDTMPYCSRKVRGSSAPWFFLDESVACIKWAKNTSFFHFLPAWYRHPVVPSCFRGIVMWNLTRWAGFLFCAESC